MWGPTEGDSHIEGVMGEGGRVRNKEGFVEEVTSELGFGGWLSRSSQWEESMTRRGKVIGMSPKGQSHSGML